MRWARRHSALDSLHSVCAAERRRHVERSLRLASFVGLPLTLDPRAPASHRHLLPSLTPRLSSFSLAPGWAAISFLHLLFRVVEFFSRPFPFSCQTVSRALFSPALIFVCGSLLLPIHCSLLIFYNIYMTNCCRGLTCALLFSFLMAASSRLLKRLFILQLETSNWKFKFRHFIDNHYMYGYRGIYEYCTVQYSICNLCNSTTFTTWLVYFIFGIYSMYKLTI